MSDQQPDALRLADAMEGIDAEYPDDLEVAAELRRLHGEEMAAKEWHEKTEWVQATAHWSELGKHRADVLRQRIERLTAINAQLLEALEDVIGWQSFAPGTVLDRARAAIAAAKEQA